MKAGTAVVELVMFTVGLSWRFWSRPGTWISDWPLKEKTAVWQDVNVSSYRTQFHRHKKPLGDSTVEFSLHTSKRGSAHSSVTEGERSYVAKI